MKFIIIDDDEVFQDLHAMVLRECGIKEEPMKFVWAQEALDWLLADSSQSPQERYGLLLDINMPKMDGWEFLDALNKTPLAAKVSVGMVSSSVNFVDKHKANTYPQIVKFIEKPLYKGDVEDWLKHIG